MSQSGAQSSEDNPRLPILRLPEWVQRPPASATETRELKQLLRTSKLNTVCEEARCPNITECFSRKTATFMILGDTCTRGCRFCSVATGKPHFEARQFAHEAEQVADAALALGLRHVVVTSVARDDLEDGGASGFVHTIQALKRKLPHSTIEVLIPDLRGNWKALEDIVAAGPQVLNHNLETVARLYRRVRPGAQYERSLDLLRRAQQLCPEMVTKTGIMLGLGEALSEVDVLLDDARKAGVESFTAGQYLRPTREHLPVEDYVSPKIFQQLTDMAKSKGFRHVAVGPLVRSSYHAEESLRESE